MVEHSWRQERHVCFQVGTAFFRPESQLARDLGVLAAMRYRQCHPSLAVLDAMSGCGVRSLRYALEAGADHVWANEGNPDLAAVLQHNLQSQLPPGQFQVSLESAQTLLHQCLAQQRRFDFIDLDGFGSPSAYLGVAVQAVRWGGLLYLTAADSRTCAGHNPEASLRRFGAYARAHPAAHEQGLRLLLGSCWQQAAMQGLAIAPIFSLFRGQLYRVMVRMVAGAVEADSPLGFIGHCHRCGHFQTVDWRNLSRAACPHHLHPLPLTLSGPMWLGPLHDHEALQAMQTLAQAQNWSDCQAVLATMAGEILFPPYFYRLPEIGRRARIDIPKRDRLIAALQDAGYRATATHLDPQALKTDATFADCLAVARRLQGCGNG